MDCDLRVDFLSYQIIYPLVSSHTRGIVIDAAKMSINAEHESGFFLVSDHQGIFQCMTKEVLAQMNGS